MPSWLKTWPHGRTWVFQGTVAEDATAGTHACTLVVTPGAGNELRVLYGRITVGATATAQTPLGDIDDGSNLLLRFLNAENTSSTTSGLTFPFPSSTTNGIVANEVDVAAGPEMIVSGTMRLVLTVSTTAVSVTQTFAVVCRIMGALPTATLADSVGTPVLTTNTNQVF